MKNGVTTVADNAVKLNLQYFSEGAGGNEGGVVDGAMGELGTEKEVQPEGEVEVEKQEETTIPEGITEEEVAKRINAEREKWLAEQEEKDRMSKLSKEEREQEEQLKKDSKIKELEQTILSKELKEKATLELTKAGLPIELGNLLDYTNKENMEKGLTNVKETFTKCVQGEVEKRLKGGTPKGIGGSANMQSSLQTQIAESVRGGF